MVHEEIGDFLRLPQASFIPFSLLRGLVLYHIHLYFTINQHLSLLFKSNHTTIDGGPLGSPSHFPVDMLGSHLEMASAISYAKTPTKKRGRSQGGNILKRHKIQTSNNP